MRREPGEAESGGIILCRVGVTAGDPQVLGVDRLNHETETGGLSIRRVLIHWVSIDASLRP